MIDPLKIHESPVIDNRISGHEFHAYNPYVNSSLGYNDEIRIPIQQQDLIVLPCESYLLIEGRCNIKYNNDINKSSRLENNAIAFLFTEIRYELNGIEIDRCKNVGITSTLKNYISLGHSKSQELAKAGWCYEKWKSLNETVTSFSFCVPLYMILGFSEDYKRVITCGRHELILIRAKDDKNAIVSEHQFVEEPKIELTKIQWMMKHITLDESTKLQFLHLLQRDKPISMSFRSWELHEYPLLPETQNHTWAVKASTQLEKPRYIIFAFQTNRKNDFKKVSTKFDHCFLRDIKLHLNSDFYPYDKLNLNFQTNQTTILYDMYTRFKKSYYNLSDLSDSAPLLSMDSFFNDIGPIVVIDCSHQNETVKSGTVDVKIEFECASNIPPNTCAYCLILHDRIVEYSPLSSIVRKLL